MELDDADAVRAGEHGEPSLESVEHGLYAVPTVAQARLGHAVGEVEDEHYLKVDVLGSADGEARLRVVDLFPIPVRAGPPLVHPGATLDLLG